MLFDAVVAVKIPGNSESDAVERLKKCVPHWEHSIIKIQPCEKQPQNISGVANIRLPLPSAVNR